MSNRDDSKANRSPGSPTRGVPVRSSEFDEDDETQVYESRVPSDFSAEDDDSDSTTRDHPNGPRARHADFDDFDDEATHVLPEAEARSLASSERPAQMRSVAAQPSRARHLSSEGSPTNHLPPRIGEVGEEEDTQNMAVPQEILSGLPRPKPRLRDPARGHRPSLVDEVTPVPTTARVRLLSSLPEPEHDLSDQTMSSPNIVRMSFRPGQAKRTRDQERESATPTLTDLADPTSTMGSEEAHLLGKLVVDAPEDATVYVDGVERGKGVVVVGEVDRFTHYIVRVHRPQHRPWSASVSLDGKTEAKVVPALIAR